MDCHDEPEARAQQAHLDGGPRQPEEQPDGAASVIKVRALRDLQQAGSQGFGVWGLGPVIRPRHCLRNTGKQQYREECKGTGAAPGETPVRSVRPACPP